MEEAEPTLRDVLGAVATLSRRTDEGFAAVDRRFESVDRRFEAIDKRFALIDGQFVRLGTRLGVIEHRLDALDIKLVRHMELVHAEIAAVKVDTAFIEQRLDDVYAAVSRHMTDPDAHRRPDEN